MGVGYPEGERDELVLGEHDEPADEVLDLMQVGGERSHLGAHAAALRP
jgi:hypothetical protein